LDAYTREASEITVAYGDGHMQASLTGDSNLNNIVNNLQSIHYLDGVIQSAFLSGETLFIGSGEITDTYLFNTMNKLREYKGVYIVDYDDLPTAGTPGTPTPPAPSTPTELLRVGSVPVVVGANSIVFTSPLNTADYTVEAWVIATVGGARQSNVVVVSEQKSGFIANDVLKVGELFYQAIVNV
jgi:hypothetical protein